MSPKPTNSLVQALLCTKSGGRSSTADEALGAWFQETGCRELIFLAREFDLSGKISAVELPNAEITAKYCRRYCNEILMRLGIERVDLRRSLL